MFIPTRRLKKYILDTNKLRTLRGNFTTGEIAMAIGLQQSNYSRMENESNTLPTVNTLAALAELYGVDIVDLLVETGEESGITPVSDLEENAPEGKVAGQRPRKVLTITKDGITTRYVETKGRIEDAEE